MKPTRTFTTLACSAVVACISVSIQAHYDKPNDRKKPSGKPNEVKSVENITKNKFISFGKMYNFSILNKKGLENVKLSPQNQTVSDKPMKYSDFKSWRNPEAVASKSGDSIANQFDTFSDNA